MNKIKGLYNHKNKDYKFNNKEVFMPVIYKPKGKAGEYGEYALNHYIGCNHGCTYCYAPNVLHKTKEDFKNVYARKNILELVKKEVHLYSGKKVFLSFVSDPYPEIENELKITRSILELFYENKVIPIILTKSKYATNDIDILIKMHKAEFGMTMTFSILSPSYSLSLKYEPKAASPIERYFILERAFLLGIKTWVSLEPVIDPIETLQIINETHGIVDKYKVGKLNYSKDNKIDWEKFTNQAIEKFTKYGKQYLIKDSLKKYIK